MASSRSPASRGRRCVSRCSLQADVLITRDMVHRRPAQPMRPAFGARARVTSPARVDLTARDFFEAPTIVELRSVIRDKIFRGIEALSDDEVGELIATEPTPPANG
jgi:hypothetical protein